MKVSPGSISCTRFTMTYKGIFLVVSLFCTLITVDSLPSPSNGLATKEGPGDSTIGSTSTTGSESNLFTRLPTALNDFLKSFSRGEQSPTLKALDTIFNRTINFPGRIIYDLIVATLLTIFSLFPPFRILQCLALALAFYMDFILRPLGSPATGLFEYVSLMRT